MQKSLKKFLNYAMWVGFMAAVLVFVYAFVHNTIVIQRDMLTKRDLVVASRVVMDTLLAGCQKNVTPQGK